MKPQYKPKNWPTDCQCTTCKAPCGYQLCNGDCRTDCTPAYDCQTCEPAEVTECGRVIK